MKEISITLSIVVRNESRYDYLHRIEIDGDSPAGKQILEMVQSSRSLDDLNEHVYKLALEDPTLFSFDGKLMIAKWITGDFEQGFLPD